jgi:pantoate--beta-alanine ligase
MKVVRTVEEVRAAIPATGVGLVPTMGALHGGHVALLRAARAENEILVASIFVNPSQFGRDEDYAQYPRDEERDLRVAEEEGVDVVFAPSVEEMYPEGFQTWVEVEQVAQGLEGAARPEHFRGVATACLKLFNIVRPERAYFGQKDAQQAALVEQLVHDLNVPVEIRLVATVRAEDGVALSSRNALLSANERAAATALPRALSRGKQAFASGEDPIAAARAVLETEPSLGVDYVETARFNGRVHLLAAVRAGRTRLIDNVLLEGSL